MYADADVGESRLEVNIWIIFNSTLNKETEEYFTDISPHHASFTDIVRKFDSNLLIMIENTSIYNGILSRGIPAYMKQDLLVY